LELALGCHRRADRNSTSRCFNPCFLGTCPRMQRRQDERRPTLAVSILVFLELALGYHISRSSSGGRMVSILVFLELALGFNPGDILSTPSGGFNPCFLGTCPRIFRSSLKTASSGSFNPCFLGTCPRMRRCCAYLVAYRKSFNPCFLGTCPRMTSRRTGGNKSWEVSILVFLELALGCSGLTSKS